MRNFDEILLRLKQAVKLTEDQDVAALLGMTKAAFSGRKKRGVFPNEKLLALATTRPDLNLDTLYILVGDKKKAAVKLTVAELEAAMEFDSDQSGTTGERLNRAAKLVEFMHAPLPEDEQILLETYRRCTPQARANLIQTAALLSAGMAAPDNNMPAQVKAKKHGPRISIGTLNGEQVVGDMTIHGNMHFGRAAAPPPDPGTQQPKPLKKQP